MTLSRNPVKTCVRPVYPQRITLLSRQATGFTTGLVAPLKHKEIVEEEVDHMLDACVIRPDS